MIEVNDKYYCDKLFDVLKRSMLSCLYLGVIFIFISYAIFN